jgi:hypothetical protein
MNPRLEAQARLDGRYEVRVLEPSPPAVAEPPWFADDPVALPRTPSGRPLLGPVSNGDLTWDELCREQPELRQWCADRWLGAWPRLGPLPGGFSQTRAALHALAEHVVAAARHHSNGKIGLRFATGGFGTPFFGADEQVRVDIDELVVVRPGRERRARITTLADAAALAGIGPGAPAHIYAPTTECVVDRKLEIEADAAGSLAGVFGFAASILEQLRCETDPSEAPSRVQLWPEHFDMAVEIGDVPAGRRAVFGVSPGDDNHDEPYVYVAPWSAVGSSPFFNATAFAGAELTYKDLLAADDQRNAALTFLRQGLGELRG